MATGNTPAPATSTNLIGQERTDRVSKVLEDYPTLMVTIRQDTAARGHIQSNYSPSGLNGAIRFLNPMAAFKSMHVPSYKRPDPEAPKIGLRTLISAGLDSTFNHNKQLDITPNLRAMIVEACPLWHKEVLPDSITNIAPLSLAARIGIAASGINPADLTLQAPSPTSMAVAFTSKVLGIYVDVAAGRLGVPTRSARASLETPQAHAAIITNYGYDVRGNVRNDAPTCVSPNDLHGGYDIDWLGMMILLMTCQVELDLDAVSLSQADRKVMEVHPPAMEFLMKKLQWFAPFSSRIMHLCAANSTTVFRAFDDMVLMWQKPDRYQMPQIQIKISGSFLEVSADGAEMFRVTASKVGSG
ncbi:NS2 [Fall chinook aquareovirus]|uniref:NS2 n=1 Tax=Fall chinook aquareovirus TaxID=1963254 RepID=UPI000994D014|nr:NS2 [Fall chinook aquareovirus]AQU42734.1 NS2 [Fall chinook aquareovirus]